MTLPPNFAHFISNTSTFLVCILLMLQAYAPYNVVGSIITSSHGHFLAFYLQPFICSAHLSALPTIYIIYHSFCVPHLFHILHPLPLLTPCTKNNPLPVTVIHLVSFAFDKKFTYHDMSSANLFIVDHRLLYQLCCKSCKQWEIFKTRPRHPTITRLEMD